MKLVVISCLGFLLLGCNSGGGSSGGQAAVTQNKFTDAGDDLTIDAITSTSGSLALSNATYFGRFLRKAGSNVYGGTFHFTLNKQSDSLAYFSDVYLDRLVQYTSYGNKTVIVSSPTDLAVTPSYDASTNGVSIATASTRMVGLNVTFGNTAYFGSISNAGVVFSTDASTMAGGDNATFFFIAQKASSLASASEDDVKSTWAYANFRVANTGVISVTSGGSVRPAGIGGNGLIAFTGTTTQGTTFRGETAMTDAEVGSFIFGFDTMHSTGAPTADGVIDGAFMLSPDKQFLLGINVVSGVYFAASR